MWSQTLARAGICSRLRFARIFFSLGLIVVLAPLKAGARVQETPRKAEPLRRWSHGGLRLRGVGCREVRFPDGRGRHSLGPRSCRASHCEVRSAVTDAAGQGALVQKIR